MVDKMLRFYLPFYQRTGAKSNQKLISVFWCFKINVYFNMKKIVFFLVFENVLYHLD